MMGGRKDSMVRKPIRILVVMGGASSEREVSLSTGGRVAAALRERGHAVTEADPRGDPLSLLEPARNAEVAWLALHGGAGEDGTIQALFDLAGVTYTGSGHLGSALAMDKDLSKHLFRASGVDTADWLMLRRGVDDATKWRSASYAADVERAVGLPVIVKPSKQGSTVGLTLVKAAKDLAPAIDLAFEHDDEVMLEAYVPGRELTVSLLGEQVLPVGEIIPKHEIYDYECKYVAGMAEEVFPARIPDAVRDDAQRQGLLAYRALKLGGCARVDFRLDPGGRLFCLEANTLPGMTATSLVPQAAQAAGITFPELCERIALDAIATRGAGLRRGE